MLKKINKNILIYIGKSLTGCIVAVSLSQFFKYDQSIWFLLSTLLVLSPAGEEAIPFTLDRIKANLIGSLCSVAILFSGIPAEFAIYVAVVVTILICASVNLIGVARPALAAVIIILMHPIAGVHLWDTAVGRFFAVLGGCLSALIISYIFHLGNIRKKPEPIKSQEA